MLPVPTAMVIPVEISEAAFLATTSIVSSKLVEEEDDDDEEVALPSSLLLLLLFDDDDDAEKTTNPLPLLFCVLFVFAFLLAKNKRLIFCFRQLDDLNEDDEDEEEKEVLVLAERVLGDAKQTLPDILERVVFLFIIIVETDHCRERKEKKKTNNNATTHEQNKQKSSSNMSSPSTSSSSSSLSSFRMCTYNVLAQCYVKSEWFSWTKPKSLLKWKTRREHLRRRLRDDELGKVDVFCLQEVDEFENEWKEFIENELNMGVFYKRRTQKSNDKKDGSLVCWNKEKFELLDTLGVEFNEVTKTLDLDIKEVEGFEEEEKREYERDCVAACVMLLHKASNVPITCVSTHLYWDPAKALVKLKQAEYLREEIERWSQTKGNILIGGDFNSLATSDVYKSMVENDYVSLMRDNETGREPEYTNVTPSFTETIDYIFSSKNWIEKVTHRGKVKNRDLLFDGCPCEGEPSDHLPIYCDIELKKAAAN